MSAAKIFKLTVKSSGFPIVLPIDGCAVDATVARFDKDQASAFAMGFERVMMDPHSPRLVSMRMPGEEQERDPLTGKAFVISDEEIRRRRLVEMTDEARAAYYRLQDEEERFAVAFLAESLGSYLTIGPGQIAVDDGGGDVREITSGADFAHLYAGRRDLLLYALRCIAEENALSVKVKNALSSLRASRPSSAVRSEPTPAMTAAEAGATPEDPASSAERELSATSGTATALNAETSSGSTDPETT